MSSKRNLLSHRNETLQLITTNDGYELSIGSGDAIVVEKLPEYFKNTIIIDSVNSGSGRTGKNIFTQILQPIFDRFNFSDYRYIRTDSASSIGNIAKSLDQDSFIIFISGDTSINEFVNNLPSPSSNSSLKIFPIPAGTGNSLALSLDLVDLETSIIRLFNGTISDLNLYQINLPKGSNYVVKEELIPITKPVNFLVVFSWAFHASLVADSDTPELRKVGLDRFKLAAFNNLSRDQVYPGNFQIGDKKYEGLFSYWVLTPAQKFEPTFVISPNGKILENNLYIISFNTGNDILALMNEVYAQGKHIHNPNVTYEKVEDKLILNAITDDDLQRRFCIDGAIVKLPNERDHKIEVTSLGNLINNWEIKVVH